MNKYHNHSGDNKIIVGIVVFLVILGFGFFWLNSTRPAGIVSPGASTSTLNSGSTTTDFGTGDGSGTTSGSQSDPKIVALAQCLRAKKVTMYGAFWCSHCQNQKKIFGEAFQYVPYVECTTNVKECLAAGIQGYPTWRAPDGRVIDGERTFEELATFSGCPWNP